LTRADALADTEERQRQDLQLATALVRQINAAVPALTEEQAVELVQALLAVGPKKRRRLLLTLLQVTKGNVGVGKAAGRSQVLKSMFCTHDYPVGRCPICDALGSR
jgi:hypothetical protein